MLDKILFVIWLAAIIGALVSAFSINRLQKKDMRTVKKSDIDTRLVICAICNILAVVLLIVRMVIK
jgi:hypothetical protein